MKKLFPFCFWLISICSLLAQTSKVLTIDECYSLAKSNYPLIKQTELIEKTAAYSLDNASKGYLPQVNIAGQATYQSDVTSIPISLPNLVIPKLSKDQYKIYGEVSQSLTDGFTINQQKDYIKANAIAENQKIEVELYKLKDRINQIFFGILLIDAQIQQTELLKKDIVSAIAKTEAAIANGTSLKSTADILQAELLKTQQRSIELQSNRKGFADMLALFINQQIDEKTIFQSPVAPSVSSIINRPELKLYEIQKKGFDIQNKLVNAKNVPRVSLFFQGGYGRPALNLLNNDFAFYYIGGARLNWNLSNFYTSKKERQIYTLNQNSLDIQKETFLFNTNIVLAQQNSEINKLAELIDTDNQIIALREKVKITANNQLENGTITANDYLTYVNAEDQAKQNLLLHDVQRLIAKYNAITTSGN